IELDHVNAPFHADNFRNHTLEGNYNDVTFHRIIDDFMIQGGDFQNNDGTGGYAAKWYGVCNGQFMNESDCSSPESYNVPDEADNGLNHLSCTISMAKTSYPNTGGSQFFIIPEDSTPDWLDGVHTVFGTVTSGCEHITTISEVATGQGDRPVLPVVIHTATASE
ncbi:MAG: peptidylprolyl isomerase, partial [Candidatus Poseidoniaceae archaeon]